MDYTKYFDETGLKSPYYRVSAKAIVRDSDGRVLVCADDTGTYELPGGGWEHGETFEQALSREFEEEMGAKVARIGDIKFTYMGRGTRQGTRRQNMMLRIVADVKLDNHNFVLDNDEVTEVRFVDREEFLHLNWRDTDYEIVKYADKLWPPQMSSPTTTNTVADNDKISL